MRGDHMSMSIYEYLANSWDMWIDTKSRMVASVSVGNFSVELVGLGYSPIFWIESTF